MSRRRRDPVADPVRFLDERLGAGGTLKFLLEYVFPDHWSFLLGEIALYSFIVLVATGVFLALFFDPSLSQVTYHGPYSALDGLAMSHAYISSALFLSFRVKAGLLMRQTHHWAADLFIAAITLHLLRIVFTGAFRKPREINYMIGVTMLALGIFEGFCGYSLPDDLLSGMGLVIAWSIAMSIPIVGGYIASAIWGGVYPGSGVIEQRLFIAHVFIIPLILAALIGAHLIMIMRQHHTQFPGPGRREDNVVGTPMWPGYALRSGGFFLVVAGLLFLAGGLIQINPIWLWGPYHTYLASNGAQPDWYVGWLLGALRMMPNLEITVPGHTLVPNPFWGGAGFPGVVFAFLYALPWIDRRFFTRDHRQHHLLERPRDNPRRTAVLAAVFAAVLVVFMAGAADRIYYQFGFSYQGMIIFWDVMFLAAPPIAYVLTRLVCRELRRSERRPAREWSGSVIARNSEGGIEVLETQDGEYVVAATRERPGDGNGAAAAGERVLPATATPEAPGAKMSSGVTAAGRSGVSSGEGG